MIQAAWAERVRDIGRHLLDQIRHPVPTIFMLEITHLAGERDKGNGAGPLLLQCTS